MLEQVEGHDEIEAAGFADSRKRRFWWDRREARRRRSRLQRRNDLAADPASSRRVHPAGERPVAVADLGYAETLYRRNAAGSEFVFVVNRLLPRDVAEIPRGTIFSTRRNDRSEPDSRPAACRARDSIVDVTHSSRRVEVVFVERTKLGICMSLEWHRGFWRSDV